MAHFSQVKIIGVESTTQHGRWHFRAIGQGGLSLRTWASEWTACNAGMREFPGSYTPRKAGGGYRTLCTHVKPLVHITGGHVDALARETDLVDESAGYPTPEQFYATPEGIFLAQHNMSDYDKLLVETHCIKAPKR